MAAVYEQRGGAVFATEFARGPWDPAAQHGGAPAALLIRAFEQLPNEFGLQLSRVTYELLKPVPLGELQVEATVVRPGRRAQLLEGSIRTAAGLEVVRARALQVAQAPLTEGIAADVTPPGPEHGAPSDFDAREVTMFPRDAMEVRFVSGQFYALGPAVAWFRLKLPIVAGEEPTGLQRLAAAADFPNGIATPIPWEEFVFINPDLTIYIERAPVGEWICLDASMRVTDGGVGFSEAALYDSSGRVGRSLQSLYVARR
jgi:hypothetical protein